jgi:hypothetical protein
MSLFWGKKDTYKRLAIKMNGKMHFFYPNHRSQQKVNAWGDYGAKKAHPSGVGRSKNSRSISLDFSFWKRTTTARFWS